MAVRCCCAGRRWRVGLAIRQGVRHGVADLLARGYSGLRWAEDLKHAARAMTLPCRPRPGAGQRGDAVPLRESGRTGLGVGGSRFWPATSPPSRGRPEIVLDIDATDDAVHGRQEGRFFHGYYDRYSAVCVQVDVLEASGAPGLARRPHRGAGHGELVKRHGVSSGTSSGERAEATPLRRAVPRPPGDRARAPTRLVVRTSFLADREPEEQQLRLPAVPSRGATRRAWPHGPAPPRLNIAPPVRLPRAGLALRRPGRPDHR